MAMIADGILAHAIDDRERASRLLGESSFVENFKNVCYMVQFTPVRVILMIETTFEDLSPMKKESFLVTAKPRFPSPSVHKASKSNHQTT